MKLANYWSLISINKGFHRVCYKSYNRQPNEIIPLEAAGKP